MRANPPYLVVGAGAQGLTFALGLALRGERVILSEASASVGGQARSFRYGDFTFDLGLHAFVTRNPALIRLAKDVLKEDFSRFYPRAASRLGEGAIVEDTSYWNFQDLQQRLCSLVSARDQSWNCMRIAEPPPVIYPRRGGFGRLFDRMASLFRARGGRLLLESRVAPSDLEVEGGRLAAVRLRGRRTPVRGCYWSAGGYLLTPEPSRPRAGGLLVLFHYLVRGRPPQPYHWVRLYDVKNPLLPRLVYYPKRFSPGNAPRGAYGVGAVVPIPSPSLAPAESKAILEWYARDPKAFLPLVTGSLHKEGLLRREDVMDVFIERAAVAPDRTARSAEHPFEKVADFWDADRWLEDDGRESGVPLQMASALKALECLEA